MEYITPIRTTDLERGKPYRLNLAGRIITLYATPSTEKPLHQTLPDQAVVEVWNTVTINNEQWRQIQYPTFKGRAWIKTSGVKFTETIEFPVFRSEVDTKPVTEPPVIPVTPASNALPAMPPVPPTPLPFTVDARTHEAQIIEQLKVIQGAIAALITIMESKLAKEQAQHV